MKRLHLIHKSGEAFVLAVNDASIRRSKIDQGFDITYEAGTTTILFLRTENFDGAVLVDVLDGEE